MYFVFIYMNQDRAVMERVTMKETYMRKQT